MTQVTEASFSFLTISEEGDVHFCKALCVFADSDSQLLVYVIDEGKFGYEEEDEAYAGLCPSGVLDDRGCPQSTFPISPLADPEAELPRIQGVLCSVANTDVANLKNSEALLAISGTEDPDSDKSPFSAENELSFLAEALGVEADASPAADDSGEEHGIDDFVWPTKNLARACPPLANGELCMVGARPGVGKTNFLLNIACRAAERDGQRVLLVVPMRERDEVIRRLESISFGLYPATGSDETFTLVTGPLDAALIRGHLASAEALGFPFSCVLVDDADVYSAAPGDAASVAGKRRKAFMGALKEMGREFGLPAIVAATCRPRRGASYTAPKLSSLGSLGEYADRVLLLDRSVSQEEAETVGCPDTGITEVVVAKEAGREVANRRAVLAMQPGGRLVDVLGAVDEDLKSCEQGCEQPLLRVLGRVPDGGDGHADYFAEECSREDVRRAGDLLKQGGAAPRSRLFIHVGGEKKPRMERVIEDMGPISLDGIIMAASEDSPVYGIDWEETFASIGMEAKAVAKALSLSLNKVGDAPALGVAFRALSCRPLTLDQLSCVSSAKARSLLGLCVDADVMLPGSERVARDISENRAKNAHQDERAPYALALGRRIAAPGERMVDGRELEAALRRILPSSAYGGVIGDIVDAAECACASPLGPTTILLRCPRGFPQQKVRATPSSEACSSITALSAALSVALAVSLRSIVPSGRTATIAVDSCTVSIAVVPFSRAVLFASSRF